MIHNASHGKPLPVYGSGENVRDWLYVEDHCEAIDRALEKGVPGEVYNIGGNNEQSNLQLVKTLCALLDEMCAESSYRPHERLITFVADRPGHDLRYAIDATKIRTQLGWQPPENLASGLRKTVRWSLDHQEGPERVMSGEYRGERLGLALEACEA